jgi:phosphatidylinositol alpha 1,6-mannosyltransferase
MRIAYLTQSYPPVVSGAAVVVHGLAEGMAQRGHQVLVLTASENALPYEVNMPGLKIQRFRSIRNPFRANHYFAPWPHREIMKALDDFAPSVVHAHDTLQFALSSLAYCRSTNTFGVMTAHQLPWFVRAHLPNWKVLQDGIERGLWTYSSRVLSRYNAVVTPTRTIASEVYYRTGIRSQVIEYGLNPQLFYKATLSKTKEIALRKQLGLPENVPVLLHVGRLDLDKKVDLVIRAAASALTDRNAHLVVIGDGTEKDNLINMCHEQGIGTRSHFPGFVDREQVLPDIFRLASVFVTASEIETQGLVLLEAAACGLPIIAVAATCIPEIVRDGVNGYLAAPGDVAGLAAHLQSLLDDPALARNMGSAGSLISQEFSLEKTLLAHEALYQRAFSRLKPHYYSRKKARVVFRTSS